MRLIIVLIAAFWLTSCIGLVGEKGNGDRVEKTYNVSDFEELSVGGEFIVRLTQGQTSKVMVEADENLLEFIEVGVRGKTLEVTSQRRLDSKEGVIINITFDKLTTLSCSGASDVSTTNPIQAREFNIDLSGAGKLKLMLDAVEVSLDVSGATLVYLEGVATRLEIDMSGAGSLEASEFEVEDCVAQISGVGKILVNVSGTLEADVSGLGAVEYVGEPTSVKGDVSGIGNIERN